MVWMASQAEIFFTNQLHVHRGLTSITTAKLGTMYRRRRLLQLLLCWDRANIVEWHLVVSWAFQRLSTHFTKRMELMQILKISKQRRPGLKIRARIEGWGSYVLCFDFVEGLFHNFSQLLIDISILLLSCPYSVWLQIVETYAQLCLRRKKIVVTKFAYCKAMDVDC